MHKVDIKFSLGDKVLISMKYLSVIGDRKLVPSFVSPFSILQWV